jgi:hypothetical protein
MFGIVHVTICLITSSSEARASLALVPYYHYMAPYYHCMTIGILAPWPTDLQNNILPCLPPEMEIQPAESQEFTRIHQVDKIHKNSTHHKIEEA